MIVIFVILYNMKEERFDQLYRIAFCETRWCNYIYIYIFKNYTPKLYE